MLTLQELIYLLNFILLILVGAPGGNKHGMQGLILARAEVHQVIRVVILKYVEEFESLVAVRVCLNVALRTDRLLNAIFVEVIDDSHGEFKFVCS